MPSPQTFLKGRVTQRYTKEGASFSIRNIDVIHRPSMERSQITDEQPSPMFKASEVEITDEGLAFVCDSEAEAQRAYWEGQLRELKV